MKPAMLDETLKQIGERLSELRLKKGYANINNFTKDYDLPLIQYWRMEKGKANITIKSLIKLLSIHRVEVHDFFCGKADHKRLRRSA